LEEESLDPMDMKNAPHDQETHHTRDRKAPGLGVDLLDPNVYARGVPYEAFAFLRKREPVYFHPTSDNSGIWCVTKHSDVISVSKDARTFCSSKGEHIQDFPPEDPR